MHQHSGPPEPKWNRQITRRIFPPDSEKSSGNETKCVLDVFRYLLFYGGVSSLSGIAHSKHSMLIALNPEHSS